MLIIRIVESSSLWSPSLALGHNDGLDLYTAVSEAIQSMSYNGPTVPLEYIEQARSILRQSCQRSSNPDRCQKFSKSKGFPKGEILIDPRYVHVITVPDSSKANAQRLQSAITGTMHHYNYLDELQNYRAYGQDGPPAYNVSQIQARSLFFWRANNDQTVSDGDIKSILHNLAGNYTQLLIILNELSFQYSADHLSLYSVPVNYKTVGGRDAYVNHIGYFFHQNVSTLFLFPALRALVKN